MKFIYETREKTTMGLEIDRVPLNRVVRAIRAPNVRTWISRVAGAKVSPCIFRERNAEGFCPITPYAINRGYFVGGHLTVGTRGFSTFAPCGLDGVDGYS